MLTVNTHKEYGYYINLFILNYRTAISYDKIILNSQIFCVLLRYIFTRFNYKNFNILLNIEH
jgi:hypothetical protein